MIPPLPSIGTLDADSFHAIAELAYRESGLTLVEEKAQMIQSRLRHRLRALGFRDFAQYSEFVRSTDGIPERRQLISALTTNVSHFFRETHHFDAMRATVRSALPRLRDGGRFRIWSAGCSNGQEPLSAAIALLEDMPELSRYDLRILATDIDPNVVTFARAARYSDQLTQGLPALLREKYFHYDPQSAEHSAKKSIRDLIRYRELNLLENWPMQGRFDIILCRNVVIYFDATTQNTLWPRYRQIIEPHGLLMLGHSERISDPAAYGFHLAGTTTYKAI